MVLREYLIIFHERHYRSQSVRKSFSCMIYSHNSSYLVFVLQVMKDTINHNQLENVSHA